MAVVVLLRYDGDPQEIARGYDIEIRHPIVSDQPKRKFHTFATSETGAIVIDIWEDQAAMEKMVADPEFIANYEKAGLSAASSVEVYEVHSPI